MERRLYPLPPALPPPPNIDGEIQNRKRRLYLIASFVSIPSVYFVWKAYGQTDPFIDRAYPYLIAEVLLWSGALLWKRIPLVWIERFVLFSIALFLIAKFSYTIFIGNPATSSEGVEMLAGGMSIVIILIYLILPDQLALKASIAYISVFLLLGTVRFYPAYPDLQTDLIRTATRSLVIALLTFILAKVKDDLISAQRKAAYWEWQANIDHLTQLPNRRMISDVINRYLSVQTSFTILLIDLDDFKCYNDTYGHDVGDLLLSRVAHTLKNNLRASDFVARWGGEEFLVLTGNLTKQQGKQLGERLRKAVEKMDFGEDRVSISIGGTIALQNDDLPSLIKRADTALYRAKSQGRNCVCWE